MSQNPIDIAFSPVVKTVQERKGSRDAYARMEAKGGWTAAITPELKAFIDERDSFYLATASADGQPYIQHRGGPKGFLKVIGETTLAFADFSGNRQYISTGNLAENDKAYIFLMDYAARRRYKLWGRARVVDDDPGLLAALADPAYDAQPEQAILFDVAVWDRNCPQHIPRLFSESEVAAVIAPLEERIAELEARLASPA